MSFNSKKFIDTASQIVSCPFRDDSVITKQMTSDFTCDDVAVGHTIMMGFTTCGWLGIGTVKRIVPGVCFEIEQNTSQISMLWSDLMIHPATAKKHIKDYVEPPADPVIVWTVGMGALPPPSQAPQLRRTDSGADYGYHGYPDCNFWSKQGITPLFIATDSDYSCNRCPASSSRMREILLECKEHAEKQGGEYLKAWQKQMESNT